MNRNRSYHILRRICGLAIAFAAGVGSTAEAAPPVFTGDAEVDFASPPCIVIEDPTGIDVGVPGCVGNNISGFDMKDLRFYYHAATDTLYVAFNTYGIAGDADGDGDPGGPVYPPDCGGGTDLPDFAGTEYFALMIDVDRDHSMDLIVGVSGWTDIDGFSAAVWRPSSGYPGLDDFGAPLSEFTGICVAPGTTTAPDIEFTIPNFSQIPGSSGTDDDLSCQIMASMGSWEDVGIGEDNLPVSLLALAKIGGMAWFDDNGDGVRQATESPAPGIPVSLYDARGDDWDLACTGPDGTYDFAVPAGEYFLGFVAPGGYGFTTLQTGVEDGSDVDPDSSLTALTVLDPGESEFGWDAGLLALPTPGTQFLGVLSGVVWHDADGDGVRGPAAAEPGLAGVWIQVTKVTDATDVTDPQGGAAPTVQTGADGQYCLSVAKVGEYRILIHSCNFLCGGNCVGAVQTCDPDGICDNSTLRELTEAQPAAVADFGYAFPAPPGTGTPGYWKNHPEAWPRDILAIGGTCWPASEILEIMRTENSKDVTLRLFTALACALLNTAAHNPSDCIEDAILGADAWLTLFPVRSGVKASGKDSPWRQGEPLYKVLDAYNNGLLCAPRRD
ncbi:MAG: hypothetical protein JXR77_18025 [Lentisphaeria bacterium]|nr:hypothetical protein [Lentisphaeria bacterium]